MEWRMHGASAVPAEIPQLQALQSQVRRLWAAQTVVVLALDRGLWIAWPSDQGWQVAAGSWPTCCWTMT
jgi:hypothetical protein